MEYLVDWFSFTLPCRPMLAEAWDDNIATVVGACFAGGFGDALTVLRMGEFQFFSGKGFYHTRLMDSVSKLSISFGVINSHIFIECTGETCEYLRQAGLLEAVISQQKERTTRIDLTADINTTTTPSTFVGSRGGVRFASSSVITSATGETCYVGSWKSDRFARVYRYSVPHPRSKNLRVEHVLKGDWAKIAARQIVNEGVQSTLISASVPFGWTHPDWKPDFLVPKMSATKRHDREDASALRWLNNTVAPSLKRAVQSGLIDLDEWLAENGLR